ncbi:MAG: thiamine pyrophosphate-binding protein [Phycisphaeraceae bacterium]|jgi:acetolactate synthase-1/2/3 large subunit|nr:thiamine pyrophosphate-binding protein [Phycisphaeraceae bacterium]
MANMKGADFIADVLIQEDIPYVFGICGHGNVGLLDALHDRRDEIKLISPRHEQIAGHMADAYFRVAHRPVATLTSCGPGSANITMSLACAQADSSAFLAITANIPTSQFNRAPFQESYHHHQADFPSVIRPYVKRSFQPSRVDMLPTALRQAIPLLTSGRPGPVNLDVPYNVFQEEDDVELPPPCSAHRLRRSGAAPQAVTEVADLLQNAKRPLLFIGHGVTLSEASVELTSFTDRLGIPVVMSPNGMGTLDMEHALSLGFIGRNGTWAANQAGRHCDVLMALGARFDDRSASSWVPGFSWNIPPTKLVHVDIDPAEIGRNYDPAIGIVADVRTFLQQLLAEFDRRDNESCARNRTEAWRSKIAKWRAEWDDHIRPHFAADTSPIRPERMVADVQRLMPEDGILLCDCGVHHNWFMQFWRARRPQRMLNAWGFSAMGFGVSGALGAKLAAPDSACVAVVGDGGFTMAPQVLCTAVEYDIPVVWVIWNNYSWAAIRDLQLGAFNGREIGTSFRHPHSGDPYNPDFAALARSFGVDGVKVERSDDFSDALKLAIAANKPFVIDAHVDVNVRPTSVGTWKLPPLPHPMPAFGEPWRP